MTSEAKQITLALVGGTFGGALTSLFSYSTKRSANFIFAVTLVIAAGFYVGFAWRASAGPLWMLTELAGTLAYGTAAVAGVRHSAWWLAAGWAAHPIWDIALHYFGPGRAFTPPAFGLACLSWDWVVAAVIVHHLVRRTRVPG